MRIDTEQGAPGDEAWTAPEPGSGPLRPAGERPTAERPQRPERERADFHDEIDIVLPSAGLPQPRAPRDDEIGMLSSGIIDSDAAVEATNRLLTGFAQESIPEDVIAADRMRTVSRRMQLTGTEIAGDLRWRIGSPETDGDFTRVPVRIYTGDWPNARSVVGDVFVGADQLVDDLQVDLRGLSEE